MDSHIGLPKLASLPAHGFILKPWVTVIDRCEGRANHGWISTSPHRVGSSRGLRVYVHGRLINKEIDFHTTKNSTSLSALGSILKDF
jgi:hypothetical protein